MINEEQKNESENIKTFNVPSAKELKRILDQYVIGQDEVKKIMSVAVHNHYRRIQQLLGQCPASIAEKYKDIEIEKSNCAIIGNTGTGKTLIAKTLAKILGVPFAIADATTLTAAGYVGEDVENVIRYLYQNANKNVALTQIGIVYIDEIDKLASKTENVSISKDVGGECVQQTLLKIIEGTICRFPENGGRKHPDQPFVEVDTSNILFFAGGAFVGLDKIIAERNNEQIIGFERNAENENSIVKNNEVQSEDLIKFGLIPEFIGRLPIIAKMNELTEDDLIRILTEPKNAIVKQYQKLLALDNVDLEFKTDALREIARLAVEKKTGARGLRSIIEKLMTDIMFETEPDGKQKKITVTRKMVENLKKSN